MGVSTATAANPVSIGISMNGVMTGGLAALGLHLDPIDCISIFFLSARWLLGWKDLIQKVLSQRVLSVHFNIL